MSRCQVLELVDEENPGVTLAAPAERRIGEQAFNGAGHLFVEIGGVALPQAIPVLTRHSCQARDVADLLLYAVRVGETEPHPAQRFDPRGGRVRLGPPGEIDQPTQQAPDLRAPRPSPACRTVAGRGRSGSGCEGRAGRPAWTASRSQPARCRRPAPWRRGACPSPCAGGGRARSAPGSCPSRPGRSPGPPPAPLRPRPAGQARVPRRSAPGLRIGFSDRCSSPTRCSAAIPTRLATEASSGPPSQIAGCPSGSRTSA